MADSKQTTQQTALNDPTRRSPVLTHSNTLMAAGVVVVLATLIIPLPTWLLDLFLTCSITLSIAVLVVTLATKEALELSTFPSLLLFVTLFRMSLNVASTRLILLHGEAGDLINTFGNFVAGGSLVVGLVIFLILVIIQFIVITKGAERISEVSARFTLDAMPGKQMAIDADLNAGIVTEAQANERRAKIVKESEFYGAMDGASKFIRGDAKAGIIITIINLTGGIAMGYFDGLSFGEAAQKYSILSIGDGLVSQIPSMIISVSSGFLVTKISSQMSVGEDLSSQFLTASKPLLTAGIIVAAMAFIPGMPMVQFLMLAAGMGVLSQFARRAQSDREAPQAEDAKPKSKEKEPVEDLLDMDKVSVHVGVRLISMVDPRKNNTIFERIGALRRKFVQELGLVMPLVRLRDDINLEANAYQVRLNELRIAAGSLEPNMFLAMDPGGVMSPVKGIETVEPVYGLPALWISPEDKEEAELSGYTVIDPESVFMTHLSESLRQHADELLTREDVQQLVDRLRKDQPSLVGETLGADGVVTIGLLQRILKNLLKEGIPIRELTTIVEALAEHGSKTKHAVALTEMVRKSLTRTITDLCMSRDKKVKAITFDPVFENHMTNLLRQEGGELSLALPTEMALELSQKVAAAWKQAMDQGLDRVVLLCDSRLRYNISELLSRTVKMLPVIAYDEIELGTDLDPIETISIEITQHVSMPIPDAPVGAAV
ncbi:MAG: flagellar biosynthesis protein FlhA [Planctomycetes bacterium]|nr:flagellar biosynthesis protein FlhA [Planctomycetota bacterium]